MSYGHKKDSKQYMQGGFLAHFGRCHSLLDVSWVRFQTGGARAVSQDELDLDATVVPLRHPGPALSWLAMEADSRTR